MTDKDLTAPEAVERFGPHAVDGGCDAYGAMEDDPHGDWVRFEDYAALSAALEVERASHTATIIDWQEDHARAEAAEAKLNEVKAQRDEMRMLKNNAQFHEKKQIARAEALDAKLKEAVEVMRLLLQVQDGLPMSGMEATHRSNKARAFLASPEGDKP